MVRALFYFILLIPAGARADFIPDECVAEVRSYAREAALNVACDVASLTKKILAGEQEAVPPRIYHFGVKKYLLENAKEGNIPEEVWKNTIMGEKDRRYQINELRRGLYGTHFIDTNSFYSNEKYDWLMEIEIKKECRDPQKVVSLARLQDDPRFKKWVTEKGSTLPMTLEQYATACADTGSYQRVFEKVDHLEGCVAMAGGFLKAYDIKVIQDHIIKKSFYVRDRSCVAGIRSTAPDLIEIYAVHPSLWINSCSTSSFPETSLRHWRLLYRLFTEEDLSSVSSDTFDRLLSNTKLLDASAEDNRSAIDSVIRSFLKARDAGQVKEWQLAMRTKLFEKPAIISDVAVAKVKVLLGSVP